MTYTIAVCTVKNSWWWTEGLSETCRLLFQTYIWEISASSWFYYNNLSRCTVTWTSNVWKRYLISGYYRVSPYNKVLYQPPPSSSAPHDEKSASVCRGGGRVSILLISVATYGLLDFRKLGFMAIKQWQATVHSIIFVHTPAAIDQIWSGSMSSLRCNVPGCW